MKPVTYKDLEQGLLFAYLGGTALTLLFMSYLIMTNKNRLIASQSNVLTFLEFFLIGILGLFLCWRNRK